MVVMKYGIKMLQKVYKERSTAKHIICNVIILQYGSYLYVHKKIHRKLERKYNLYNYSFRVLCLMIFFKYFKMPFSFLFTLNIQLKKLLEDLPNQEYIMISRAAKCLIPKALAEWLHEKKMMVLVNVLKYRKSQVEVFCKKACNFNKKRDFDAGAVLLIQRNIYENLLYRETPMAAIDVGNVQVTDIGTMFGILKRNI